MQRLRCVVAVALVLVLTGCEGVGEDNEIDLGQFGQLLGENLSPAQREELSQFLSDRLTAFVEEKVEGVAAEADELRAVRDGLDDADQRRQSVDQLYNADDSGPHVNETVKKKGKEEEEEEEGRVAEGENAARMARRVRRHSVLESAETAEAATTYIPPPALKQLIDAFLQDTVGPLVDKLSTMMTAATTEAATPKLTASITEAVGPQCTAALTESLTPCIVKSLTQELTSSLTKSLTHSVTQSLTNTLTHSLTHTLTHCLTYSLTRSLTHTLTQTLTQTVTHAITKALYQVVANLHNNYNYYLYYQCYYYYNHCQHVNHGVKCYFPQILCSLLLLNHSFPSPTMMAPRPPVCLVVLVFLLVGGGGVWLDPTQSITFARERGAKFFISFLDGSSLEGFLGRDIVQMGPYYTEVEFGIVPESGISGHWDHDGILGMGLGEGGELPEPYLFSLSDEDRRGDYRTHVFSPFIFTLVLTDAGGELQIGGYDEQAIDPTRPQIHSFSLIEDEQTGSARYFTVSLAALRLGGVTILNEKAGIPAVVDSGTACFVLPTRHGEAAPYENIYEYFYSNFTSMVQRGQKPSVFLRFHGSTQEIEVPFREFAVGNVPPRPCLTPVTNFDDVILGDPFFRTVIAIHDLTDRGNAQIRFAYRNPSYMLLNTEGATATSSNVSKIALLRKQRGCTGTRMDDEDKIPVEASRNRLSYYADVAIGTPRQERITLLLDTGSSLLAVFALSDVSLSSYFFYVLSFLIVLFVTAMYGLFHWYTKVEKAIFDEQWEEEMEGGANVLESETESDTGDRYVEFEEVPRVPVAVQPVQPPPPITSQDSRTPIFTAQGLELQSTS